MGFHHAKMEFHFAYLKCRLKWGRTILLSLGTFFHFDSNFKVELVQIYIALLWGSLPLKYHYILCQCTNVMTEYTSPFISVGTG